MASFHHFRILYLIVFLIGSTISAWIAAYKMKRKIRKTLGRSASDTELTSLNTWMQVEEKERRKPLG
jgi:hypothetical protein